MQDDRRHWDDRRLIAAAVQGDSAAAAILFTHYDAYLRRVAAHYASSPAQAADAVGAAWATALERLDDLRNPDRFGAWMAAIVRNAAIAGQRAQAKEILTASPPDSASETLPGEDVAADQERLRRAREVLLGLPARDRKVLELSIYEKLPVAEVAAALMIDVNCAYQVISRARKRARRAYLTPAVPEDAPLACKQCAARTPDYLRGRQPARADVDEHVSTCPGCQARLAEMLAEASQIKGPFGWALLAAWAAWWGRSGPARVSGPLRQLLARARLAAGTKASAAVLAGATLIGAAAGVAIVVVPAARSARPTAAPVVGSSTSLPQTFQPRGRPDRVTRRPSATHRAGTKRSAPPAPVARATTVPSSTTITTTATTLPARTTLTTVPPTSTVPAGPNSGRPNITTTSSTSSTTSTTVPPSTHPGAYLTGDGTPDDSWGSENAIWTGPAAYGPGPSVGAKSFAFSGYNGLTDPTLPQLGSGDFSVNVQLETDQQMTTSQAVDLLGYRQSCGAGDFFDIRLGGSDQGLAPPGHVFVEFDSSSRDITELVSASAVNDGQWHEVSVTRVGPQLSLSVDGVVQASTRLPPDSDVSNEATWQAANGDPCLGVDGTMPLQGHLADIYVGPPSDVPQP